MKKLKTPTVDAKKLYINIQKNKDSEEYKETLENLQLRIFDRYIEYETNKKELEKVNNSKITDSERKCLLTCYSREGYIGRIITEEIYKIQLPQHQHKCPYCYIGSPDTIDHYIPKKQYPEFAILPINLIPCCSRCNGKKGESWKENGKRLYINYYFDDIPKIKFLKATICYDQRDVENTTKVKFTLINKSKIEPEVFDIIKNQYNKLELLDKYCEIVDEEISNLYSKIKDNSYIAIETHLDDLGREIRNLIKKYGINFWKVALYEEILESKFVQAIYLN